MYKYILLLFVSFPCFAWTDTEIQKEVAWQVLNVVDWGQTRDIAHQCQNTDRFEYNPVLGRCPDRRKVDKYFVIAGVAHYLISDYLTEYRTTWQNVTLIVTGSIVYHNASIGLNIRF